MIKLTVQKSECIGAEIAGEMHKSAQYVGKVLNKLLETKLLSMRKHGKNKYYAPSLDAVIAYGN